MSSEAPCCFALGPMKTSTLLKKTQHSLQCNSKSTLSTHTSTARMMATPTKRKLTSPRHFFHVLFEPWQTPLKSTEVAQTAIQDSHMKVENSKWWPMANWWFISSCSRSRWTSQVGNLKTRSSFDGDQQLRNNEHYLHIGHIQCWPTSYGSDGHYNNTNIALCTNTEGPANSKWWPICVFLFAVFDPNLKNLIRRWPTWTGHRRPQTDTTNIN